MKAEGIINDSDSVYNNTRGKVAASQKASSNHKRTIVEEGIKHSSKKKKVEEVVEPLVKYHPKCKSGCQVHNNNKMNNEDIKISNDYYQKQTSEFNLLQNKSGYLKLCKELGTHYGRTEDPCTGKLGWYLFPLSPDTSI